MKVENTKVSDCRLKLAVAATADETREDYDNVIRNVIRNAQIPGFRPGKAPLAVIRRRYDAQIKQEINGRLVNRFIREAIEHEKLTVTHIINVEDVIFSPETGITFAVTVDVRPEVELPDYQKLGIKANEIVIDEKAVDGELAKVRKSCAKSEDTEAPSKDGDYMEVSFEATTPDGAALEGVPEASNRYVKSEKFWLMAGEKPDYEAIPESGKAMIGLKKGDDFSFKVTFPKDFTVEELRKVKAVYKGKVLGVRTTIEPTDEELCKSCQVESIEVLRKKISEALQHEAEGNEHRRLTEEITKKLLKKAKFAVPESDTQEAAQMVLEDIIKEEVSGQEDPKEYAQAHAEELRGKAMEKGTENVRLRYIIEGIAEKESIKVSKSDVDNEIAQAAYYMSMRDPKAPSVEELRKRVISAGNMPIVESQILSRKVIDFIVDSIKKQ